MQRKNKLMYVLSVVMVVFFIVSSFAACGGSTSGTKQTEVTKAETQAATQAATEPVKEVELRFTTGQVGESPEAPWFTSVVEGFNARNTGKIKIAIDSVAGASYFDKVRTDIAADSMADLFMMPADNASFTLLAESGRGVDLNPYFDKLPELKARLDKDSVKAYSDKDGKLLALPYSKGYIGIFYNKDLFAKAGIQSFPTTWDDFMKACESLKKAGITPISLQTGENAWTTALLMADMIGTDPEGNGMLQGNSDNVKYDSKIFIDTVKRIQELLQKYTTKDAVGATYGISANHFQQADTAMIANGPWMIGDFSNTAVSVAGLEKSVDYAIAPGDGVISFENIGYASGSKGTEKIDAAVEVLKYMAEEDVYAGFVSVGGCIPTIAIDLSKVKYNPINAAFTPLALKAKLKYTNLPTTLKAAVMDALPQLLPDLVSGKISAEQFAQKCKEINDSN
jgi:raffinose/stachyose/melibiose transport system substrate-binding protein